jgi:hypothetical protein
MASNYSRFYQNWACGAPPRSRPYSQALYNSPKECGLYNLEFHYKDTEAPQERLCVLCAFVV